MEQSGKQDILRRLNRVEGQVRGVARMVEEDQYCLDILVQVAAIRAALNRVGLIIMEGHAHGCLVSAVQRGESKEAVAEFMDVIRQYTK